ncbi:MAG: FAD-dependent oxidoreductase [Gammaproteobacteria bacterium]|nr:FAD-dependent oxidoreductase [Gammaproteobacteria bacterium]MDH3464462.1 FAD-dependent oxidoreductase [Gammaproteobacteria bacterium]
MNHIIIGAGPAGVIAAETLRRLDSDDSIIVIGDEDETPYSRMALPYLLAENIGEDGTHLRHGADHYAAHGIRVLKGRVTAVDTGAKNVTLEGGDALSYDKLLIATGSHASRPPIAGMDLPGIENCWTLADARRIAERAKPGAKVVLMGAGFIGCIVLEALAARNVELTVIEMADRMLARMMDDAGAEMIRRWCEQKGVRVLIGTRVESIDNGEVGLRINIGGGEPVAADLVVCATGVAPNVGFLEGSGINTDLGVIVDDHLQSNVADVYAAGDVAQGPDFSTGQSEIHAIQPTASEHARIAAANMAGRSNRFDGSLSMNVLNTLGLITSSFGLWDGIENGERATVLDKKHFKYLRLEFDGDILVGALAIGLTQHVGVLRGLIQTRVKLGHWKRELLRDPHQAMSAYLGRTQGDTSPLVGATRAA